MRKMRTSNGLLENLTIIIPAYNEEDRLERTLEDYLNYFPGANFLVERDGCMDRTPQIVSAYAHRYENVNYVQFPEKLGKGGGLKLTTSKVDSDFVAFVDADGSIPPPVVR